MARIDMRKARMKEHNQTSVKAMHYQGCRTHFAENRLARLAAMAAGGLGAGCATQRMAPPLFATPPEQESPEEPRLIDVPTPPGPKPIPIAIVIPQKVTPITEENIIMRKGAVIKPGSSVVISVPGSLFQRPQDSAAREPSDEMGFRTDGYFNVLEQYIERGLIAVGLQVKDRSKFEAKLRDLRDTTAQSQPYEMALGNLQKDLDGGRLTREEFTEKSIQLRDKLLGPGGSNRNREEMKDISEVIRAAQDGEVMADYVLQVNDLAVKPFAGAPLQLAARKEVQAALTQNPGLRIGSAEGQPNSIPPTLAQPWAQARFNAKLIEVKTGSIDWIGEYGIESLAVLNDGLSIMIGVRRHTANGKAIVEAISAYNRSLSDAYRRALDKKADLDISYQAATEPYPYFGTPDEMEAVQNRRRFEIVQAEQAYTKELTAYQEIVRRPPAEAQLDWTYEYDVDAPSVSPDLLKPKTEQDQQSLLEHVKSLGFKVTHDLLKTIKIDAPL